MRVLNPTTQSTLVSCTWMKKIVPIETWTPIRTKFMEITMPMLIWLSENNKAINKAITTMACPKINVFLCPNFLEGTEPIKEDIMFTKLTIYTAQITEMPLN